MAEFVKVMSQFMRLCDNYRNCGDCPVNDAGFNCDCDHQGYSKTGAAELESIIMQWAAEHPEPVYPTWTEYFRMIGVFPSWSGHEILDHTHIPADIAQKLGIEPKK